VRALGLGLSLTGTAPAGGGEAPPEGMAFLFAENGDPILDENGEQVYAKEPE
jgi:hypothetical protein